MKHCDKEKISLCGWFQLSINVVTQSAYALLIVIILMLLGLELPLLRLILPILGCNIFVNQDIYI